MHVSLYEFAFVYVRGVRFAGKGERVGRGVVTPAHWPSRRTARSVCVYLGSPHQDCHLQAMENQIISFNHLFLLNEEFIVPSRVRIAFKVYSTAYG